MPSKKITKSAAVRAAIDAGADSPEAGIAFIKQRYGIAISKPHFHTIKSNYRRKRGLPPKRRGRPRKAAGRMPATVFSTAKGEVDVLRAMETMKPLVASLGAANVKRLIDLLG